MRLSPHPGRMALALVLLASAPVRAGADLYQWTDGDGVVRYTAHLERVPRKRLADALVMRRDAAGVVYAFRWGEEPRPLEPPAVAAAPPPGAPAAPPPRPAPAPRLAEPPWPGLGALEELALLEAHAVYRTRVRVDGRLWERVRLGFFASPAAARRALAVLRPHFADAWLDRADPAELAAARRETLAGRLPGAAEPSGLWVVQLGALPVDELALQVR